MMTYAYYNDTDPYVCAWVRNLIKAKLITDGEVDERPIQDVRPIDLKPFTRAHFFCGIAGWELALRQSNWPADRKVWTGSCPCQGFSAAGQGRGFADERHLWPFWFHLIGVCRPPTVFGEQVASKLALDWLDLVQADLESANYAVGTADLCAAGVGAPHIRQRLWFVAGSNGRNPSPEGLQRSGEQRLVAQDGGAGELGNTGGSRLQERERDGCLQRETLASSEGKAAVGGSDIGELVNPASEQVGLPGRAWEPRGTAGELGHTARDGQRLSRFPEESDGWSSTPGGSSPWSDCDYLPCTDGKARPVEPGTFPLAHGVQCRASKLRAYGNAIVPQVAAEFINATIFPPPR